MVLEQLKTNGAGKELGRMDEFVLRSVAATDSPNRQGADNKNHQCRSANSSALLVLLVLLVCVCVHVAVRYRVDGTIVQLLTQRSASHL